MNTTFKVPGPSHSPSYVLLVFSLIMAVLIVVGNSLVIAAYRTNARLQTHTNAFIVSLAVSDLLVGVVSVPIWTYLTFVNYRNIPTGLSEIYLCFDIFSALASIFHLTAIAVERYFAVSRPFSYGVLTFRVYKILIFAAWLVAAIIAALSQVNRLITLKKAYTVFVFNVGFVLPTILMLIMYANIFRTASSLISRTPSLQTGYAERGKVREERKVALTVSIVTGLFLLAWSPFFVSSMLAEFCASCLPKGDGTTVLVTSVKWMHYSNSAVNPLVFVIRHGKMGKSMLRVIGIRVKTKRRRQASGSSNQVAEVSL